MTPLPPHHQRAAAPAASYTPDSDADLSENRSTSRSLMVLGAIATIIVAGLSILATAKHEADATYVRADSFAVIRAEERGLRQRDSLILDSRLREIEKSVGITNTNVTEVLRVLRSRP
jgi:hypothetical protein